MKHGADGGVALTDRPLGKCNGDVRQRAAAMMTKHVPSEVAEHETDDAGGAERQPPHDGAEGTKDSIEDAAAKRAPGRNAHTANSMGRLLSFARHEQRARNSSDRFRRRR